jgi:3-methylfumaryl-CoA hydratase
LWNGHRIHFDEPYAKEVEGYPGLVIAGPLLGDWLNQVVELWLGESGRLTKIEYSNRVASYIGETLTAGGNVTAVEGNTITIEVYIKNEDGDVIAPGVATAEIIA